MGFLKSVNYLIGHPFVPRAVHPRPLLVTLFALNIVINSVIMFSLFKRCFGQLCERDENSPTCAVDRSVCEPNVIVCDALPAPDQQLLLLRDANITGSDAFELPLLVDYNNNRFPARESDSSLIAVRGSSPDISDFEDFEDFDDSSSFEPYSDFEYDDSMEHWHDGDEFVIDGEAEVDLAGEVVIGLEEENINIDAGELMLEGSATGELMFGGSDMVKSSVEVMEMGKGFDLEIRRNYCGFEASEEEVDLSFDRKESGELMSDGDVLISRGGSLRESE